MKLTPTRRGEAPSRMRIIGAANDAVYGSEAGAFVCFNGDLFHESLPPESREQHLKMVFFFAVASTPRAAAGVAARAPQKRGRAAAVSTGAVAGAAAGAAAAGAAPQKRGRAAAVSTGAVAGAAAGAEAAGAAAGAEAAGAAAGPRTRLAVKAGDAQIANLQRNYPHLQDVLLGRPLPEGYGLTPFDGVRKTRECCAYVPPRLDKMGHVVVCLPRFTVPTRVPKPGCPLARE